MRETIESTPSSECWWRQERERLVDLVRDGRARYVYHLPTVARQVRRLVSTLRSVDRIYYSMKANPHPGILETVAAEGLGIECVSAAEALRARQVLGAEVPLLFTPNFCPMQEYETAIETGAEIVIDGPEPLDRSPSIFKGRDLGLRVDLGRGLGHHEKVRTAGAETKFGHPLEELDVLLGAAARAGARIVGLHAHLGSGILEPEVWTRTGRALARSAAHLPDVRWLDLGGGLGVPERPGLAELDLEAMQSGLVELKPGLGDVALRLEPGRYLVSQAGVLLAHVTQVRRKAGVNYAGLTTGMNSLLRPTLYDAWHGIHNLSRLEDPAAGYWHVVGPICESGDVLGRDRLLPATHPGDVMLIENAGAYGAVMGSSYNLRPPAEECVLES